jgi:hypothetical protein
VTNKGMGEKSGHTGSDKWKNSAQNQQRGSEEKGEQGAASGIGHSVKDNQAGMTGEPGQSQGMDALTAQPTKKGSKG